MMNYGECPVHHYKFTSALICPYCTIDEFEAEEEKQTEEEEEQNLIKQEEEYGKP